MDDDISSLPREVLLKALKLRDCHKKVYITLYSRGPSTVSEIAKAVGLSRTYTNVRLLELVDMGLAKKSRREKNVVYEVI